MDGDAVHEIRTRREGIVIDPASDASARAVDAASSETSEPGGSISPDARGISAEWRVSLPPASGGNGEAVRRPSSGARDCCCQERKNVLKKGLCPIQAVRLAGVIAAGIVACSACTPGHATGQQSSSGNAGGTALSAGNSSTPLPAAGSCHLGERNGQPTPDPSCTPGAVNPQVSQANIATTVCKSGWTKTVRPATGKTSRMKDTTAKAYTLPAGETGEYDHLVSLELGGAPDDPRNLWVEPGKIPNPKDAVENKLKDAVCSGLIPLATAQTAIAHSWTTAFDDAGLRVNGGSVCLRAEPSRCAHGRRGDSTGE
ncbi:hypothetical protein [Amycolatopsis sp. cg13]|uniref:hypothetical protein n=1 Tax=Amycolatopsis sp. cg13 TaxID=3238807 RepID=UPI003524B68D